MPRPRKNRIVHTPPLFPSFKPSGVRQQDIGDEQLSLDEYEAIRLADYEGLDHESAAGAMQISRSTFTRLLERAHQRVAAFLVEGKQLSIGGGSVHFAGNIFRCRDCGHVFPADFMQTGLNCPECCGQVLQDIAARYGHGRCCRQFQKGEGVL